MPWFWVDDAFADSKPVMALDRSLRNEAIGLWVRCGAWSAKEETDGRVSLDTVKSFDGTPRLIRALHEQAGLWTESSPESWRNSREILFKSWEKWQKTKAENEAKRKADAERQANYRRSKKGRGYVAPATDTSDNSEMSRRDSDDDELDPSKNVSRRESQRPDPDPTQTRPDPSLVETSLGGVTSGDAREEPPRPKCPRHDVNGNPNDDACRACKQQREWDTAHAAKVEADQLDARRRARQSRLAAIDNCRLCDEDGWLKTDYSIKCNHQEASNA